MAGSARWVGEQGLVGMENFGDGCADETPCGALALGRRWAAFVARVEGSPWRWCFVQRTYQLEFNLESKRLSVATQVRKPECRDPGIQT